MAAAAAIWLICGSMAIPAMMTPLAMTAREGVRRVGCTPPKDFGIVPSRPMAKDTRDEEYTVALRAEVVARRPPRIIRRTPENPRREPAARIMASSGSSAEPRHRHAEPPHCGVTSMTPRAVAKTRT